MRYAMFDEAQTEFPICFLVPEIYKDEIKREYLDAFEMDPAAALILSLHYPEGKKKAPVKEIRAYLNEQLIDVIKDFKCQYVAVADPEYFKELTGQNKAEANLGYVMDSSYGDFKVIYLPNVRQIFYDPDKVRMKIAQAMESVMAHASGTYAPPGNEVIKHAEYPRGQQNIKTALNKLLEMDCDFTADIEAFSLKHNTAGIGTITFCWNQHEGVAFAVDYEEIRGATEAPYGRQVHNAGVRAMLKEFIIELNKRGRKLIWHHVSFDVYVLIYQLFMRDVIDTQGLLTGMDTMLENWDCTKLISYLATNSCAGNRLSLKEQAQEFAGNYAVEEIDDITKIPLPKLLEYNLVDGLSTWFVYNKRWPQLVADQQQGVYEELFKPAIKDIVQMQLTGLPINMKRLLEVKDIMEQDFTVSGAKLQQSNIGKKYTYWLNEKWVEARNAKLKKKRVTLADANEVFNPNSSDQLRELLYDLLQLPVIATTKSKQASTDAKTLKSLRNHTKDQEVIDFLNALLEFASVNTILTTFMPAMLASIKGPDGWYYLCGYFNLGGTVSGRLSSSDPNLQNLPANSKYAKLIKSCIMAPPGWVFCGLDFASLEDRISALTTKDPMKLKVYTDGYDGHAMRAVAYWGATKMGGTIDILDKDAVNAIAEKGHVFYTYRQDSKAPTFALTYQGTFSTLMKNCGFSKEEAQLIEANFKSLYHVSVKWVDDQLEQATKDGYVTVAFGLRVRTPLLHQVIRGSRTTPREAVAEGRTAGNALGQSWCLLNSRAASEFMGKVRASKHRLDIRPCAHIHDAQYYLIREDIQVVNFVNRHLVEAVEWQAHPAIEHPDVKLGGELSLFYPTWADEMVIPNGIYDQEILDVISKELTKRDEKKKQQSQENKS
ncbi:DNA polymerase I [Stenotrophomonas phage Philippe]|uniref:DNA polymerase I n=1 Tax=Stenotrophomonas phage Philippe TaxID=2859655 RepID=A0AAE8BJM3_9CAUD|nr:DNA polymerase I [Stenotrophomonas phage Philippe]QYW02261.1 DNA polymerase I [Stenotrophomonas phage Philippe]